MLRLSVCLNDVRPTSVFLCKDLSHALNLYRALSESYSLETDEVIQTLTFFLEIFNGRDWEEYLDEDGEAFI